jgi:hypothetical protein
MLGVPLVLVGGLAALIVVNNKARARALDRDAPASGAPDDRDDRDDRDDAPPPIAKAS